MSVKITGLDKMQKQLKEVERATEALNGSYDVHFDANDPVSIENAIQEAYSMVYERASGYATNPMVSPLIEHMKENRHCCKVSDEAAFCLIQRPYISKTLLTRRISPRGSP
ncbi:hypothetical protein O5906_24890 [Escherichia coli]|nr:hypothetical protein [Escherichia coli]MCZ5603012.1 hypothetical protein [Escherichia coli]